MAKRRSGASRSAQGDAKAGAGGSARAARGPAPTGGDCVYAGQEYSEGAIIEQGGVQQRCVNGKWQIVDPAHRGRSGLSPGA